MKAILISIKPKYVADILNGRKTIEIRKTMPKCDLPIDVYIYCTKDSRKDLASSIINGKKVVAFGSKKNKGLEKFNYQVLNGKVVAKFTLNKCQDWHFYSWQEITKKGCVSDQELQDYERHAKTLYIWEIDDLEIFDKPKELSDFATCNSIGIPQYEFGNGTCDYKRVIKAPQSFMYVEVAE